MPTLELTTLEAKMLEHLLDIAGNEFSNHGCNDFNLQEELKLSKKDAIDLNKAITKEMVAKGMSDKDALELADSAYMMDWLLFAYFERKVQDAQK